MKETMEFKTETKRLLDLMINSIYTHKEIFLRELISNASDAIDKRHYLSLTDEKLGASEYKILVEADKATRTLSIIDNGIGMTKEQLVNNLGTIARSGSKEFMDNLTDAQNKGEIDIIGQFGVGFYSAFMVAKEVEVYTKSIETGEPLKFTSEGLDSYTIESTEKEDYGTKIVLHLRDNTEDVNYDNYLDEYTIKDLVRKYSDYVRYPIQTWVTKYDKKDENAKDDEEEKTHLELETINSMIPLWKKNKSEVTDEELNNFYKQKFMDYQDPLLSIFVNVEGMLTYNALLFIPKRPPFDLYSEKYEKGLQLYTKGVFILDKCKELIPDYLRFVKGLVDSADLSLNISREMLQEDRSLKKIASNLEKKILSELGKMLKNDREKYEEFFKEYGVNLKYGLYEDYGAKKEQLKDLIILNTLNSEHPMTFSEYVAQMPEGQKEIYYASGKDKNAVSNLPQMDLVKKQGYNVFVLTDDVDEFMIQVLAEYDGKKFKSINQGDLNLLSDDENKAIDSLKEEKKDLLAAIKEALNGKVEDVILSKRLVDGAVCLSCEDGFSFEMERVLAHQNNPYAKAKKILEINPNHEVFKAIEKAYDSNKDNISKYANILYNEGLLLEGMPIDNPVEFTKDISELLVNSIEK